MKTEGLFQRFMCLHFPRGEIQETKIERKKFPRGDSSFIERGRVKATDTERQIENEAFYR